jgi:membrane associated rhomboid family serine protease
MEGMPPVVMNLLIINGLLFAATYVFASRGVDLYQYLAMHHWLSDDFRIWQPFTYMFLHGNMAQVDGRVVGLDGAFMHLFSNMFGLWMFGSTVEYYIGAKRFLQLYLISGLGAIVLFMLISGNLLTVCVGASGAVFGVLFSFGYLFPNQQLFIIPIPFPIKAKYMIALYAAFELYTGINNTGDGVAHMAHLAGMLVAFILLRIWKYRSR